MEPESEPVSFEILVPSMNSKACDVTDMHPGIKEEVLEHHSGSMESHHDNVGERLDTIKNLQIQHTDKLVNLVDKKLSTLFSTLETEKIAIKKQIKEAVDAVVTSVAENAPRGQPENFDKEEFFTRFQDEMKSGIQRTLRKYVIILGLSILLLILAMSGIYFFVNFRNFGIHNYPNHLANEMSALAENIKRANSRVEEVQMTMTSSGMSNGNEASKVMIGFQQEMAELKASVGKLPIDMVKDLMQKVETCDTKAARSVELKVDTLLNELRNVKSELKLSDDMLHAQIHHTSDKHSSHVTAATAVLGAVIFMIILALSCCRPTGRTARNAIG